MADPIVAKFISAEKSVRPRGAATGLAIWALDWLARLNEHVVLSWVEEHLKEEPLVVELIKWAMDHPFLLSIFLLISYILWVALKMRNDVTMTEDKPVPVGRELATTTYGTNSPAATIGSIETGAKVHIGNIYSTVPSTAVEPSITKYPIFPMHGRHRKVSMPVGTVAQIERGGWRSNFSIELKDIGEAQGRFGKPESCAHVHIDTGGGLVYGGPRALYVGVNEFKLLKFPNSCEGEGMAYAAYMTEGQFSFIGVYVLHINPHAKMVDLCIVTVDKI